MNENNIFPEKKEINPFSDIEKSPLEGISSPVEMNYPSPTVGKEIPDASSEAPTDGGNKEDADIFLQSILKDSGPREDAPTGETNPNPDPTSAPAPETSPLQEQESVGETEVYKNLVDLGEDDGAEISQTANRTTMQDIIPSDKVTGFDPQTQKPHFSGRKMLFIAGAIAVFIVAIYLVSSGGTNNNATDNLAVETSVVQQFPTDTTRKSDLAKIKLALVKYDEAKGFFPKANEIVFLNVPENLVSKALAPTYIDLLPSDPDPSRKYGYKSDGKDFTLSAVLDNSNDPSATVENEIALYKITSQSVEESANNTNETSQPILMENQAGDYVFEP